MTRAVRALALLAVLALAGCVAPGVRSDLPSAVLTGAALEAAQAQVAAREARVQASGQLGFTGRVALSNGRDGGSGRIEWRQLADAYDVVLSAPVTRQSWRLTGDAGGARIEGLEGGPFEDVDVERLLLQATGQEIPVGALAAWAAGTRADTAGFGPAQLHFSAQGALLRIEQGGWVIDYPAWGDAADGAPLPRRVDAQRGASRVRLVVDAWQLDAAGGAPDAP